MIQVDGFAKEIFMQHVPVYIMILKVMTTQYHVFCPNVLPYKSPQTVYPVLIYVYVQHLPRDSKGFVIGFPFFISREEQFQRLYRFCAWHSCTANCIPWSALAVTSGSSMHNSICFLFRDGVFLQTVSELRIGSSICLLELKISEHWLPLWRKKIDGVVIVYRSNELRLVDVLYKGNKQIIRSYRHTLSGFGPRQVQLWKRICNSLPY